MPDISVIIVHWNTSDLLERQLENLKPDKQVEVIIVDNDTLPKNKKFSDSCILIRNDENLGFGKAANRGEQKARGKWLLFLNSDVLITTDEIKTFAAAAERENLSAAAPATSDTRYTKPLPTPLSLLIEFSPLRRVIPLTVFKQRTLTGGCLLIRRDVFERVGKWDEDFFLWFEDSDLTKRLIDTGERIGWVNVNISHKGGASFESMEAGERRDIFFRSMKTYADKHFSGTGRFIVEMLGKRHT